MKLDIFYDPNSDTLDIGNGKPASEGYVVFFTLENAVEVLAPYLREHMIDGN